MSVLLTCPLCAADAAPGRAPAPGACASCGALIGGGGSSAPEGVALALAAWGIDDPSAERLTTALFVREPEAAPAPTAAIASDSRDGFYLWWVFVRPGVDLRATLAEFVAGA
ncbi:MAG TPA: hypothetical protein PKE32_10140 [Miltoncostaeaceae bacterium]|nr:hypothetical protein [Miltoncostaeaceae bacterium]